jgi:hypothetical protein
MLLLAMMGPAEAQPRVTKLLRETIGLYDESGALIRRVPRDQAPKLPLPVVSRNATGQLGVRWDGGLVYLRNSEVIAQGLLDECRNPAGAGRGPGSAVAASEGIGSGMGGTSSPCVR